MVDVTILYDDPRNLKQAYSNKVSKYSSFGTVLPLVISSLGSWDSRNDNIRAMFNIDPRRWKQLRHTWRLRTIEHTLAIIRAHTT